MRGNASQPCDPQPRPKLTLTCWPLLGFALLLRGGLQKSFLFIVITATGGGGVWGWQMDSELPPPFPGEWSVPTGRGRVVGEQMATPSFQCLPRWLPPHSSVLCSGYGVLPGVTGGSRPGGPDVYLS